MGQRLPIIGLAGEDRLWIDSRGGFHSLDRSHGAAFEAVHRTVTGAALPATAWQWMHRECGSLPCVPERGGEDWAMGANPGWQFVEYAKHVLGWIRVTTNVWVRKTEIAIEFDGDAVTEAALKSLISTIRFLDRHAPSEVIVTDDFGNSGRDVPSVLPGYWSCVRASAASRIGRESAGAPLMAFAAPPPPFPPRE